LRRGSNGWHRGAMFEAFYRDYLDACDELAIALYRATNWWR
jgi:hypothetical protein